MRSHREQPLRVSAEQFERLVSEALTQLPEPFAELLDNVFVAIEETPSVEDLEGVGMSPDEGDELLGLYQGISLDQRGADYAGALPDRVVLYRRSILKECRTTEEVRQEVLDTLVHELGHHFGLGDDDMPY